jgi:hypothetical protein
MDSDAASRLAQKTTREAIIGRIADDLHMAPFLARAYFEQMAGYFQQYAGQVLEDNQVRYCAIAAGEPAGRQLADSQRLPVQLTLVGDQDLASAGEGVIALRRQRVVRLCREAFDQGALLTQEDLALVLTTSVRTIRRDLRALRAQGIGVPTRGQQRDIGPGVSHRTQIVRAYLLGEGLGEISLRLRHGVDSMERYLRTFRQVALMTQQGLGAELIQRACRVSPSLVAQYQALFHEADAVPQMQPRLRDLLGLGSPPAAKKGGR